MNTYETILTELKLIKDLLRDQVAPTHIFPGNQIRFVTQNCQDGILAVIKSVDAKNQTATLGDGFSLPFAAIFPIRQNRDRRPDAPGWLNKKVLFLSPAFTTTLISGTVVGDLDNIRSVVVRYLGGNGIQHPRYDVFAYERIYDVLDTEDAPTTV